MIHDTKIRYEIFPFLIFFFFENLIRKVALSSLMIYSYVKRTHCGIFSTGDHDLNVSLENYYMAYYNNIKAFVLVCVHKQ